MNPLLLLLGLMNTAKDSIFLPMKNRLQKELEHYKYELQKNLWSYQQSNAYQLQRKDMFKAGINPAAASFAGGTGGIGKFSFSN